MCGRSHWLNVHKWKHFELQQKKRHRKYFQYVDNFGKARGRTGNILQPLQPMWQTGWCIIIARFNGLWINFYRDSLTAQIWLITVYIFNTNREIHPDGLPPSYTIILLFRLLPDTPSEPFDIWQIADKNNNPEVGITVNRKPPFCFGPQLEGEAAVADPTYTQLYTLY